MLTILGPAKTIDMSPQDVTKKFTMPEFNDHAAILVNQLRELSISDIKALMKVSDKLAEKTAEGIATWKEKYSETDGMQAIMAFSGEVFNGLRARLLEEEDLQFAQSHVRILSGMYGVLKPLDLILPYRLEMGTKLSNEREKNLYDFWKRIIPAEITSLTSSTAHRTLLNLASNEYFKSIQPGKFPHRIITPVFKEQDGNGYRNVTIYAKKARGMMLRFVIKNRIENPADLKAFDEEGYFFNSDLSSDNEWFFTR